MNRAEFKAIIQPNLGDIGSSFYSVEDLNNSIQDAYDEMVVLFGLRAKRALLTLHPQASFINVFQQVPDYCGAIAVWDVQMKRFLYDDVGWPFGFQKFGRWQTLNLRPTHWAPVDTQTIVFMGKTLAPIDYELHYFAGAPVLSFDADQIDLPRNLVSTMEEYVYADLLEQFEEYTKAQIHWDNFARAIGDVGSRLSNVARSAIRSRLSG